VYIESVIVIIMLKSCTGMWFIEKYYFTKNHFTSLFMVSLPLFGCFVCLLCVWWSYDICVIHEQLIM